MNKKGQISSLTGIVSSLLVIAIFIVAGLMIIQEFYEQDELVDTLATVTNETAYINETGYTLLESDAPGLNAVTITVAYNDTSGDSGLGGYNFTIPSGNYTVSSAGIVTNATTETYDNISISYTYQYGEDAYEGINDTLTAVRQIPNLLGLVILILMMGLVLAIVFNVIPGARVSGA